MAKAPSRATHFGRALGIGARLAAKSLSQPAPTPPEHPAAPAAPQLAAPRPHATRQPYTAGRHAGRSSRNLLRGVQNFFQALAAPIARTTHSLWLETTGLFFALFAVFFLAHALSLRGEALHGPNHPRFLGFSAATLLFVYFSATSFARARRRSRR